MESGGCWSSPEAWGGSVKPGLLVRTLGCSGLLSGLLRQPKEKPLPHKVSNHYYGDKSDPEVWKHYHLNSQIWFPNSLLQINKQKDEDLLLPLTPEPRGGLGQVGSMPPPRFLDSCVLGNLYLCDLAKTRSMEEEFWGQQPMACSDLPQTWEASLLYKSHFPHLDRKVLHIQEVVRSVESKVPGTE